MAGNEGSASLVKCHDGRKLIVDSQLFRIQVPKGGQIAGRDFGVFIQPPLKKLQILAPCNPTIQQVSVATTWATYRLVEIGQLVRIAPETAGNGGDERHTRRKSQPRLSK